MHPTAHLIVPAKLTNEQVTAFPTAMIDSGATSEFISQRFVNENNIPTRPKEFPIHPVAIDGHSLGLIDQEVQGELQIGPHKEQVTLDVANIGKHPIILGAPWLYRHNPQVDWRTRRMTFDDVYCSENCLEVPNDVLGKFNGQPDKRPISPIIAGTSISARIAAEHAPEELPVKEAVPTELHEFLDVFEEIKDDHAIPPHRPFDCKIDFKPGATLPKPSGLYQGSAEDNEDMKKWVTEMTQKGFIRPSNSPIAASCFFVGKKDGKKRLVIDYRKLNEITIPDRYPIPLATELIERLAGKEWFTNLDLRSGYHLIRVAKGDEWKTAFKTWFGLFEWTVMPFGLCNAPAVFQRFINHILHNLLDSSVLNYLDDTMPATKSREENVSITKEVLRRFRENNLRCNAKKCKFFVKETEYLGLWVSKEGVSMDKYKVEAIREWPAPTNIKEIQTFLGFANFYRRFIHDFSSIATPITGLLRKDVKWNWTQECAKAFETLKERFTTAPVLRHHDPEKPSTLETDASGYAYGAILSQKAEDGKLHPNAFMSKSFTTAEANYDVYDKEMLAIVRALKYWQHYLKGAKFKTRIKTDHKNLQWFMKTQTLNARQHRWLQELADYDFEIEYRPGAKSGKPDALSRRPDHRPEGGAEETPLTFLPPSRFVEVSANEDEDEIQLETDEQIVRTIESKLEEDPTVKAVLAYLNADPDSAPANVRKDMAGWSKKDGLLRYKERIYVPNDEDVKKSLLQLYHDAIIAGHPGQAKTLELLSRGYFWPSMKAYVNRYVEACDTCQRNKPHYSKPTGLLKPLPVPEGPWQDVSYDFITKLPATKNGNDTILAVVDRLSKEAHFVATQESGLDAQKTSELFIANVWKYHGLPARTVSDRGPQFNAPFLRALYNGLGIKPTFLTAYHPQTDGQTERVNQNIEGFLRIYCNHRQDDWDELLPFAEFSYNNTMHSSTGETPFMVARGYNPMFTNMLSGAQANPSAKERLERIHTAQEVVQAAMKLAQEKQKEFYDRHRQQATDYAVGDKVWLEAKNISTDRPSTKLAARRLGPFLIESKISTHAYKLALPPTMKIHPVFHVSLLTPHVADTIPGRKQIPPPPILVDEQEEWEVEKILNSRLRYRRLQYLIKWKGFSDENNTWKNAENLEHASELVDEFHQRFPQAPTAQPQRQSSRLHP